MIPRTGRAIILTENNEIITIKRTRYNEDGSIKRLYYTFPGGHLEGVETYEEATIREVYEELGINVELENEFLSLCNEDLQRDEKFYIAKIVSGTIGTGNGPEFQNIDYKKYGKYEIVNIKINELEDYNLLPIEVKEKIIDKFKKVK